MGRCRGRSKEQPKNTPISLHDRRLQHPKECSIPVTLCPPAIVRLFLSGYLFLSPPLSQSFLSFSFSLSFPPFFLPLLFPPPLLLFLLLLVLLLIRLGRSATRSATTLKVQAERSRSRPSCLHVRHSLHRSLSLPPSLSLCWSNLARGSRSIVSEGRGREESRSWSGQVLMARLRVYDLASSTIRDDDWEKGVDELFAILFRSCSSFESFEFRGVLIE